MADIKEALGFIIKVKSFYGASSREYIGFIDLMGDLGGGRANSQEAHRRVIALFQGHSEFVQGYTAFIPPGHTIDIPADPQGNILLTTPTGTMEVARDGTVVNEIHVQPPEPEGEKVKPPESAEREKRLLETLKARIADEPEQEEYKALIALFEANLTISPEQRKASLGAGQGREFEEKLQELLGDDDELKKALSDVLN